MSRYAKLFVCAVVAVLLFSLAGAGRVGAETAPPDPGVYIESVSRELPVLEEPLVRGRIDGTGTHFELTTQV